jgi:hypothetical protein
MRVRPRDDGGSNFGRRQSMKGRKVVSPERAVAWAKVLGFPPTAFVKLALQEQLDRAGVKMNVEVEAA